MKTVIMDISLVFTQPRPAGIDLSENRTHKENDVVISICAVAALTVVLRFVVRIYYQRSRPEVDDWLIAASLVPLVGLLAAAVLCVSILSPIEIIVEHSLM